MLLSWSRLRSLRMSLASMLTWATSLTMQPILSLVFSSRYRSKVVFPATTQIFRLLHGRANRSECLERSATLQVNSIAHSNSEEL